ncbi:DsbA family protein [Spirabiliibacterium falconis]|uniref:DsbA family protein n=1 Tax=Spirabiliibacterium falconis TaxID=572023 RepID=UPI001AACCA5F|nr:DsbA family protein [Spirabiliibacterium falconis]MBE2893904.1 thioredoxin domain-containing protein [Spirabiliibacterium falconis]
MKKWILMAFAFVFSLPSFAADFTPEQGKQYETVNLTRSPNKQVIEFFSFYCPHCAAFQLDYHIPQKVQAGLPSDAQFIKYHVKFLGRQSENLSRAWAFANVSNTADKVEDPLFKATQAGKINSMDDIRQVFIDAGVSAESFDSGINSFAVNGWLNQQTQTFEQYKENIEGVPAFFVNGNHKLRVEGFKFDLSDAQGINQFADHYAQSVLYLLNH